MGLYINLKQVQMRVVFLDKTSQYTTVFYQTHTVMPSDILAVNFFPHLTMIILKQAKGRLSIIRSSAVYFEPNCFAIIFIISN